MLTASYLSILYSQEKKIGWREGDKFWDKEYWKIFIYSTLTKLLQEGFEPLYWNLLLPPLIAVLKPSFMLYEDKIERLRNNKVRKLICYLPN